MFEDEIIEDIKEEIDDYIFQSEKESYIKGYLDALCKTHKITWEERYKIEEEIRNE